MTVLSRSFNEYMGLWLVAGWDGDWKKDEDEDKDKVKDKVMPKGC